MRRHRRSGTKHLLFSESHDAGPLVNRGRLHNARRAAHRGLKVAPCTAMNKYRLAPLHRVLAEPANLRCSADGFQSLVIKPTVRPPLVRVLPVVNNYVEFLGVDGHAAIQRTAFKTKAEPFDFF
jgi:hypothetical protein